MTQKTLLKTEEAADVLAMQPQTLAKWRTTGEGPLFLKLGRSVRYRLSDLQAWLDTNTVTNTAEAERLTTSLGPRPRA